jgi:RNA 2',3'-cyclic 3'-phosphodiesterase
VSDRPRVRLFAAVELPDAARAAIEAATQHLRTTLSGLRWVPAENLHLTLVFLGWVDPDQVDPIREELEVAAAPAAPFRAGLGAAGRFPDRGTARVVWFGFTSGAAELDDLAGRVRRGVAHRVAEDRPFRPHVTVARAKHPVRIPVRALDVTPLDVEVAVDAVTLFRSHLGGSQPRYEAIARLGLRGGAGAG